MDSLLCLMDIKKLNRTWHEVKNAEHLSSRKNYGTKQHKSRNSTEQVVSFHYILASNVAEVLPLRLRHIVLL